MSVQAWNAAESDAKWCSSTEACVEADDYNFPPVSSVCGGPGFIKLQLIYIVSTYSP